jgi:hypothetical protein
MPGDVKVCPCVWKEDKTVGSTVEYKQENDERWL